jgi:hypothetical protein
MSISLTINMLTATVHQINKMTLLNDSHLKLLLNLSDVIKIYSNPLI